MNLIIRFKPRSTRVVLTIAVALLGSGWCFGQVARGQNVQDSISVNPQWAPPIICAHRGALNKSELANSVTVIKRTVAAGIPMVEVDLHESKDGTIYLLHGRTLNRTTNGTGPIRDYTDRQLTKVFLVDPITRKPVQPIPTFKELLKWDARSHARIMVDIKRTPPADAVKLIRKWGDLRNVVILTFNHATAERAYASDPNVLVSVLVKSDSDIDRAVQAAHGHPTALYVPQKSAPEVFVYARDTGMMVITDGLGSLDAAAMAAKKAAHGSAEAGYQVYEKYLRHHPVNVFVTNHALMAERGPLVVRLGGVGPKS